MKETYDFRLFTDKARLVLGADYEPMKNSRPGFEVFHVKGVVGDSLYRRIEDADRRFAQSADKGFISCWRIMRTYTDAEIERAQLFLIRLFCANGAGEEYGTWYTDGELNGKCAFERKLPVGCTFKPFKTIWADNWDLRCALSHHGVTGSLRWPWVKL
jgi:hypothetical protein